MRLRTRFTLNFLLLALLPLLIAMGISLWHSTSQTRSMAIDMAHSSLRYEASHLSTYFAQRLSEMRIYARMPLIRAMDFAACRPFLLSELERHAGVYEKFLLGLPSSHYYYTGGGNPALDGLASFDDADPQARPKSIRKRDYWQYTLGENDSGEFRAYVSNPMISYTTGAKQVMVAVSVLTEDGTLRGMFGGALPWPSIERLIARIKSELESKVPWGAKFMLVSPEGVYWYHWDADKIVHLARHTDGSPVLNEIGEKVSVKSKITDEPVPELAAAGREMLAGREGHAYFVDPETGEKQIIIYSPIEPGGYSVAALVPESVVMAPVFELQRALLVVILVTLLLIITAALLLSRRVTKPILELSRVAHDVALGDWKPLPNPGTGDEVADLTQSFNSMTEAVRKREQLLREKDERFERAVRGTSDALWDWNIVTNEVWYAKRVSELLGYTQAEFPPVFASLEDKLHPDDHARVIAAIEAHFNSDTPYDIEFRLKHRSGEYRWFRARGIATRDETGKPVRMSGSNMDITEQKKVEASLILAKEEAEHANLAKSQFLSSMSHELRTPLNAILGFSQLMSLKDLPADQARQIQQITSASLHLRDLVNQVLDLSQIEAGYLNIRIEAVNVAEILAECIAQISDSLARPRHVEVVAHACDCTEPCMVTADRLRLRQVIINLLSNAVKYNHDHGRVDVVSNCTDDGYVRIAFSDTGLGIPAEQLDRLFDPFERLDFKHHGTVEGTGIGLTVTRQLIEAMQGEIGVDSEVDVGSTFWILLPHAQA